MQLLRAEVWTSARVAGQERGVDIVSLAVAPASSPWQLDAPRAAELHVRPVWQRVQVDGEPETPPEARVWERTEISLQHMFQGLL